MFSRIPVFLLRGIWNCCPLVFVCVYVFNDRLPVSSVPGTSLCSVTVGDKWNASSWTFCGSSNRYGCWVLLKGSPLNPHPVTPTCHTHPHIHTHTDAKQEDGREGTQMRTQPCLCVHESLNGHFSPHLPQTHAALRLLGWGQVSVGTEPAGWSLEPGAPTVVPLSLLRQKDWGQEPLSGSQGLCGKNADSWQPPALPLNPGSAPPSCPQGPSAPKGVQGGAESPGGTGLEAQPCSPEPRGCLTLHPPGQGFL